MLERWASKEELLKAQVDENTRAMEQDDIPDPICECGNPGCACICEQLGQKLGYWPDGTEYQAI